MPKIHSLTAWLRRKTPLNVFNEGNPNQEFGGFVVLDVAMPIHEAGKLPAESLRQSWQDVHSYMSKALKIIDAESPGWLDREEVEMIRESLGEPPMSCYPLYFIAVGDKESEKAVYVGKTSSSNGRFKSGHSAMTKLHAPQYDGLPKTIYLATVMMLANEDYLPLEWVQPLDRAELILESIENQLIYDLRPELNKRGSVRFSSKWPTIIMIENHSGASTLLHGHQCSPPA